MTSARRTHVFLALLALTACRRAGCSSDAPRAVTTVDDAAPRAEPGASAHTPDVRAQQPDVPAPGAPDAEPPPRDIAGLRVRVLPGGVIQLQGRDRWGGDVSTTYESAAFLERSLPALERSITPDQANGLRAMLAELRAAARSPDAG